MKLFTKEKVSKEQIDTSYNPYLDAKQEWMERYGDYISQKRNWQIVAIMSIVISLISVLFLGYIGSQNKLVPYIIEVDKLGNTSKVGMVGSVKVNDANMVKFSINTFVSSWRSVWGNIETQRKFIFDAYNYIEPNSKAFSFLNSEYQMYNPFKRLEKENIKVKIKSIVQVNSSTWQAEWEEIRTDNVGDILDILPYRAILQVKQIVPSTEEEILKNPLGIFISDINYSKIL